MIYGASPLAAAVAVGDLLARAGLAVHIGEVLEADPPLPYALVLIPGADLRSPALGDEPEVLDTLVQVTCVDSTPRNAALLADRARGALMRRTLDVPGYACEPLRLKASSPVVVDREVTLTGGRHPALAADRWRVHLTRLEDE